MKINLKIGQRLTLAFGSLLVVLLISNYLTSRTAQQSREVSEKYRTLYAPSLSYLRDLSFMITDSKMLIKNWVHIDRIDETPDKVRLKKLHSETYPALRIHIDRLSSQWSDDDRKIYKSVIASIDTLFDKHRYIMNQLANFTSYDDALIVFETSILVESQGEVTVLTDNILKQLAALLAEQELVVEQANADMSSSFEWLQRLILLVTVSLVVSIFLVGFFTTRSIVSPVLFIRNVIRDMGIGKLPEQKLKVGADEIGDMSAAINALIDSFWKTSKFAEQVGKGNFQSEFQPLSQHDILGNSLVEMRESLKIAKEEEDRRKKQQEQAYWASKGLDKLGDILSSNKNVTQLSSSVLDHVLQYMQASAGTVFRLNDDNENDVFLQPLTCSYDADQTRRIIPGKGIIGICAIDKSTNYIADATAFFPDMVQKTTDKPNVMLITPLKVEQHVIGVLEIMLHKKLADYEIDFVERLASRLAPVILSIITHERIERKVIERTAEVVHQKEIIEEKNKNITDSINYAKRIQEAMMPQIKVIKEHLPESFVLLRPRDIVSGDFYWFSREAGKLIIAAIDCTGHGVPGAFMSMIGDSYLHQIVSSRGITEPGLILDELNKTIQQALKQTETDNNDGMDMALCVIDLPNKKLQYAGARNPLVYIKNNELTTVKATRMGIGSGSLAKKLKADYASRTFETHTIDITAPMTCYLSSDGYHDQVGGEHGNKKIMTGNFHNYLLEIHQQPMNMQRDLLEANLIKWMGKVPQVDDVLVIGFRLE